MSEYAGLDNEVRQLEAAESIEKSGGNVISLDEAGKKVAKSKRKPFHYWKIGDRTVRLKLNAGMIEKVESKYGNRNITSLVMDQDIPSLSVMLTITQAAAIPWEHGISFAEVKRLYDKWVETEDGNQSDFFTKIILPTLAVSGFFTDETTQKIMEAVDEEKQLG